MARYLPLIAASLMLCACQQRDELINTDNIDAAVNIAAEEPDLKNEVNAELSNNLAASDYDARCAKGEYDVCASTNRRSELLQNESIDENEATAIACREFPDAACEETH
jgi:hypothetical protein